MRPRKASDDSEDDSSVMKTCCCCMDVRIGTIVLGFVHLVSGLFLYTFSIPEKEDTTFEVPRRTSCCFRLYVERK